MINRIGVVGAGQMGAGIAQVAAMNEFSVILHDISKAYLERAMHRIEKSLSSFLKKGRITEQEKETIGRPDRFRYLPVDPGSPP